MDTLCDYIKWMGDYPISKTGFTETDALIFCALSYIDMTPLFKSKDAECTLSDCRSMIDSGHVRVMTATSDPGFIELLMLAAESRRYGFLHITDYVDIIQQDPPLQFAALCFQDDHDFSFLAYRGTDNSVVGWKEDFMISFTLTQAQQLALDYANEHITTDRKWYVAGHSKGGNLALYACCMLDDEKWNAVEHLYLMDGPGFCPEVLDRKLIQRIDKKATQIVPPFCIVGKLFSPNLTDTRIIRSSYSGFFQHSIISWEIDHGRPALAESYSHESLIISEAMDEWIRDIDYEERPVFVAELFDVLTADGADTLDEIRKGGREGIEAILRRLYELSDTTKQYLKSLPKYAYKARVEKIKERLKK